jgi:hypothetical protein
MVTATRHAGLFAIVRISILIGKPFTLQYARKSTPPEQWDEPGFIYVCRLLAWRWAGTMGFMTIISAIPPIVDGDATVRDADDTFSVVCYWVLPFLALGVAMIVTSKYPDWFVEASGGEAAPEVVGSRDALAAPVDDAGGPVVHLDPAAVLADETAAVRVTGVAPGGPSASAPRRSMPSGIDGDQQRRPRPTPRARSNSAIRTL